MPGSIPAAVKPAARAASTAPKPPGVGAAWPTIEAVKYTNAIAAIEASGVKARTEATKHKQYEMFNKNTPNTPEASLAG